MKLQKPSKKSIQSQFLFNCVSRAIDAAEEVLPLFEAEQSEDDRPRRAIDLAKRWRTLIQQSKEVEAKQMEQQLKDVAFSAAHAAADAAHAAADAACVARAARAARAAAYAVDAVAADAAACAAVAAAHAAANAIYATNAVAYAVEAIAYAERARGNNRIEAREEEFQWQDEEAARLIKSIKGEIFWDKGRATLLLGKMNLEMWKNDIQMLEARKVLL